MMWTQIKTTLMWGLYLTASIYHKAAFAAHSRPKAVEISPFGATALNTGSSMICPHFHNALQYGSFSEVQRWFVGETHEVDEHNKRSKKSHKALNCVNDLLLHTDLTKPKVIIFEGGIQQSVPCESVGFNPKNMPNVTCIGFESTKEFQNDLCTYVFQFIESQYNDFLERSNNIEITEAIIDEKIQLIYKAEDVTPHNQLVSKIIELRQQNKTYQLIFNDEQFKSVRERNSHLLMEDKRIRGHSNIDYRLTQDPNSKENVQKMLKRDNQMLKMVNAYCNKTSICIVPLGKLHIDATQTVFANIGNEARRVVGELEKSKDKNPYAILLQLSDTQQIDNAPKTTKKHKK